MSLIKSTTYAPDIFKALRGILLVHKPAGISTDDLVDELKHKICDQLNEYEPRPLSKKLIIDGSLDECKKLIEVPNLADHPLVLGPRYQPWDIKMVAIPTYLSHRSSGVMPILLGPDIKYYRSKFRTIPQVSIYHLSGRFGYVTDTMFNDGKIIDKTTFKHIKAWKIDNALSRIQSTQRDRLFDSANVPLDSEEAYELAKAWPSRPPKMARWPVIYRLRCIHLALPEFKLEVTIMNENEQFLAHLCQDIGVFLRSSAHVDLIRRVKFGCFDISDCLTSSEWDIQSIVNNLKLHADYRKVQNYLRSLRMATSVRDVHNINQVHEKIAQHS